MRVWGTKWMDGLIGDGKKVGSAGVGGRPWWHLLCIVSKKNILCKQADVKHRCTLLLHIKTSSSAHLARLCVGRPSRLPALTWSTVACTCEVCKTQSWKAGSSGGVGQLGPAGSQRLMWLAAWLAPLRCWQGGQIYWPQATTEVGKTPPPSRAFLPPLSSGAQQARPWVSSSPGWQLASC